ncbi:hypothetical protein SESBI_26025 [Sesbania bispinosa]|nr:hypothetical protein SESBI_26025 [Sesbania bispinosa]
MPLKPPSNLDLRVRPSLRDCHARLQIFVSLPNECSPSLDLRSASLDASSSRATRASHRWVRCMLFLGALPSQNTATRHRPSLSPCRSQSPPCVVSNAGLAFSPPAAAAVLLC